MNKVTDFDGPQTHSERLKVEYAPVVAALYRTMVGFAPGGEPVRIFVFEAYHAPRKDHV